MKNKINKYCSSIIDYKRWPTREVMVGDIGVGGNNPIRVQSMTTTNTMDTKLTIEQSIRMIEAGCEIVRITAPSIKDAKNLKLIQQGLRKSGYSTPLVADIHFTPNAAQVAAKIVDKVRINPGNFADKKKFEFHDYSEIEYQNELDRIYNRFSPLVKICKEHGTAMRIGTNHGSLSDRILSRYGDTPIGMVESAMEFLRICEDHKFHNIILSMKSSNTQVMVQAYRLLINKMANEDMFYPLHLGVTEAGDGEDGRIKSCVGIGTLLEDGIGDTIRVSLTEEPENEMPIAKKIAERYNGGLNSPFSNSNVEIPYDPYFHRRRKTFNVNNIGSDNVPVVISDLSHKNKIKHDDLAPFGYLYSKEEDKWHLSDQAVDYVFIGNNDADFSLPGTLSFVQNYRSWNKNSPHFPLYSVKDFANTTVKSSQLNFIYISELKLDDRLIEVIKNDDTIVLIHESDYDYSVMIQRNFVIEMINKNLMNPFIIKRKYNNDPNFLLRSSIDIGALMIDGLSDGIWLSASQDISIVNQIAFGVLQASRMRISKTEYISCPSCGRTLFDLQETTSKIREVTNHLKGVKIGIMGCIVNGPGEMADADYGYVGTGVGNISLYKGQEVVKKNIPTENAVEALIDLIKEHGDWLEPSIV